MFLSRNTQPTWSISGRVSCISYIVHHNRLYCDGRQSSYQHTYRWVGRFGDGAHCFHCWRAYSHRNRPSVALECYCGKSFLQILHDRCIGIGTDDIYDMTHKAWKTFKNSPFWSKSRQRTKIKSIRVYHCNGKYFGFIINMKMTFELMQIQYFEEINE